MSAIQQALLGYDGAILRPQDVFSAYPYAGNSLSSQTVVNGINLASYGGMVHVKSRGTDGGHIVVDSLRGTGTGNVLLSTHASNGAFANTASAYFQSLNSNGFTVGAGGNQTNNALSLASWAFRKAPKFFDVVTYTGNGVDGREITHSLAVAPGRVVIKRTDGVSGWAVNSRHVAGMYHGLLNTSDMCNPGSSPADVTMTNGYTAFVDSDSFALYAGSTGAANVNLGAATYVAYIWAHDPSPSGIILCDSFVTNGSGVGTYNHGWAEGVQYVELKCATLGGDWENFDTARTPGWSGNDARLRANLSNAEDSVTRIDSSGTTLTFSGLSASKTYIFTMIRAPI